MAATYIMGHDGSRAAESALGLARTLADAAGARVTVATSPAAGWLDGAADDEASLLVVPERWAPRAIRTIVAGHGGRGSEAAVATAVALGRILGAHLVLIAGVYDPAPAAGGVSRGDEVRARQEAAIGRIVEREHGPTDAWLLSGPVAAALVDACRERVDLLVVGHRRSAGRRRGSVARDVIARAPCPVLVVPDDVRPCVPPEPAAMAGHAVARA